MNMTLDELVQGGHGVSREYATLAPKANASPLKPLINEPLTDVSIGRGPDHHFYMTGSAVDDNGPAYSSQIHIWRSNDLENWSQIRTLNFDQPVQSPEIHYLQDNYYLTLSLENSGTALVKFYTTDW